ncbi:Beta-hexosaminidase 1 [Diplonema papillatum]|nr:Beta-hexosaminidase 1 [Diplonema papillatum]
MMRPTALALLACGLSVCSAAAPNIWPVPMTYSFGTSTVQVSQPGFKFTTTTPSTDLTNAFARYTEHYFPHTTSSTAGISEVTVTVSAPSTELQLGVDESYNLSVTTSAIAISAVTQFGAYHAMETLSQLIVFDFNTTTYLIHQAPVSITDAPRFPHREVLVDSSRHFEPLASLKKVIASFTYAKINTLHWHLVDEQSFPYDSPSFPLLSRMGAYSGYERFSQNDVKDIVEFARQRGIRVVVEVDTPGHAASWCGGYPEICPSATCNMPLNPSTNKTFDVIKGVFSDLKEVTIDTHFHIGSDEVDTSCWDTTPEVKAWLTQQNLTATQAYGYFVNRVSDLVHGLGRSVTGWEEIWNTFGTSLNKSTIIQTWLSGSTVAKQATAAGYRVIYSNSNAWYLDHLDVTWETMYAQEPCTGIDDNLCDTLVLGGGGEMWGETVDTSDIEQTIWPRLAAIAERLWSPRAVTSVPDATPRMRYFRCLLNRRGVAAAPTTNTIGREAPVGPGSCFDQ